ncbi:endonuclease/exonuclease/phosphatase family protein [Streptomyces sp. MST-110588]|uniref:endonuclease/exonuclease/phosphatase family protein n=1 Tax=Streptomyces sp. MST-110588 TaxID=2833628 RepID=UPI001F5C2D47|nr:endonuclease/exonuclease/phosphatase family protein [Streptomyces sp. MST-110588]UNO41737.1 endonuclease/exonuclease/phosphatase family protein [Streptomyces sp. MST-110588]
MRLRHLWTALCSAAFVLAGTVTTAHADTVPPESAPPLRFVSYNICGNMCVNAPYDNQQRIDSVVDQAKSSGWKADQIFLQEVCRPQFNVIADRLRPMGLQGRFTPTISGNDSVCGGSQYGVAIFVKGRISEYQVLDLTQGGEAEPITVPCVKSTTQGRLNWACSVHLYWRDAKLNVAEARQLAAQVKVWRDQGTPVVLGGDFNRTPRTDALSEFYSAGIDDGGVGAFVEADETDKEHFNREVCDPSVKSRCRSGAPTIGSAATNDEMKIDYLFFDEKHFRNVKGDVLPEDPQVSDHRMIRGAAAWAN